MDVSWNKPDFDSLLNFLCIEFELDPVKTSQKVEELKALYDSYLVRKNSVKKRSNKQRRFFNPVHHINQSRLQQYNQNIVYTPSTGNSRNSPLSNQRARTTTRNCRLEYRLNDNFLKNTSRITY